MRLPIVTQDLPRQTPHDHPMARRESGVVDFPCRRPARRAQHLRGVLPPPCCHPGQAREHRQRGHPIQEFPWVVLAPLPELEDEIKRIHARFSCTSQRTSQWRRPGGTGGGTHGVGEGIGPYMASYVAIVGAGGAACGVACASMAVMRRSTMPWICCCVWANCACPSASAWSSSTRCWKPCWGLL